MTNLKSDLGKLLHHALLPFRKPAPDDADIPVPPAHNPTVSTPALFIDDLDLSDLAQEERAITSLHALCGKPHPSLDRWFADELLPELMAYGTVTPDGSVAKFRHGRRTPSTLTYPRRQAGWGSSLSPMIATVSASALGPMPKALSTMRASPRMSCVRLKIAAWPLRSARITSNPMMVA